MNDQATGLKIYPEKVVGETDFLEVIKEIRAIYEDRISDLKARIAELELHRPPQHITFQKPLRQTLRTSSEVIKALEKNSYDKRFPVEVNENQK